MVFYKNFKLSSPNNLGLTKFAVGLYCMENIMAKVSMQIYRFNGMVK